MGLSTTTGALATAGAAAAPATFGLSLIPGAVSAILDFFGGSGNWDKAEEQLKQNISDWQSFDANRATLDSATMAKQQGLYDTMLNKIREGGLDASDRAKVAGIIGGAEFAAKKGGEAAEQASKLAGTDTGVAGLVSQKMAAQAAGNQAAMAGGRVAGEAEEARRGLMGTAATTGAGIQGQQMKGNEDLFNESLARIQGLTGSRTDLAKGYADKSKWAEGSSGALAQGLTPAWNYFTDKAFGGGGQKREPPAYEGD